MSGNREKESESMSKERQEKEVEVKKKIKPWCVRCQTTYDRNFYISINKNHTSGYLPYCKKCIGEIHEELFFDYDEDLEISIYSICRLVDIPYKASTLELAYGQVEKENERNNHTPIHEAYKYYFSYLNNALRNVPNVSFNDSDVSLKAIKATIASSIDLDEKIDAWREEANSEIVIQLKELRKQFGEYSDEELLILKKKYDAWDSGANLNTVALRKLVTQMCKLELIIDKKMISGEDYSKDFNSYAKLLDQTGLKPIANTGISDGKENTIGMRIKQLEETKPADSLKLRKVYNDLDDHEKYFRNYLVAPIKKSLSIEDSDTESMELEIAKYKLSDEELAIAGVGVDDD